MKQKPDMNFWGLWNLSFGFFGVQIAYALQSANISRIFATLGADPHNLSYFWILPPLMGILVQPIVGTLSDKTWNRFGRRIPYLFVGATMAVLVMCLLPNAGSFGLAVGAAMIFGLVALMFLDTSINMAMQPFKMLVGDMVNEKQKAKAYSIQSFLCNVGSVVGFVFPFVFTWFGIKNVAEKGVVPDSVIWSFYIGAAILILCVLYTTLKVKEWNPKEYAEYNGRSADLEEEEGKDDGEDNAQLVDGGHSGDISYLNGLEIEQPRQPRSNTGQNQEKPSVMAYLPDFCLVFSEKHDSPCQYQDDGSPDGRCQIRIDVLHTHLGADCSQCCKQGRQ